MNGRCPVRLVIGGGAADEVASALKVPHTRHDSLVLSGLALIASSATLKAQSNIIGTARCRGPAA